MFTLATDVATRLGRALAEPEEAAQVQAWLDDTEALVVERIPDLMDRVAAGSPSLQTVIAVVSAVVIRKINNPTGKLQERIDDYSYGLTATAASADLALTDAEWARLTPASASGAFSIRPGYESGSTSWTW